MDQKSEEKSKAPHNDSFSQLFELLEKEIFSVKHTWIVIFLLILGVFLLVIPIYFFTHSFR